MEMNLPFEAKLTPDAVANLIDFGIAGGSRARAYQSMRQIQTRGVAGLWNILCEKDFAYLADEVGMGKTYQALGLISLLWNYKPDARVVIICPRNNLQVKWKRDYNNFIENNYRRNRQEQGDDRLKSILLGEPVVSGRICGDLREFALEIQSRARQLFILRHTSFMRPVFIREQDLKHPFRTWEREQRRMKLHGLHPAERSRETLERIDEEQLSLKLNVWFAEAMNRLLHRLHGLREKGQEKAIDLLIMDEAQYLRNDNQTNTVLRTIFKDQVSKWLFMSATPVHSGRYNIQRVINDFAQQGYISDEDVESTARLRERIRTFMIRRPREYYVPGGSEGSFWPKARYRAHRKEENAVRMLSPLESLTMAVVQKKLVHILDGKNNRFRIGCLSSFESLQASVYKQKQHPAAEQSDGDGIDTAPAGAEGGKPSDLYITNDVRDDVRQELKELPDMRFVESFARRYQEFFDATIPHPKVDFVIEQVRRMTLQDGEKIVVFTRRINTVDELVTRLTNEHDNWLRSHIQQAWRKDISNLLTRGNSVSEETVISEDLDDEHDGSIGKGILFEANKTGGWLHKFRQTFRESGRNSLMFEENWFRYFSWKKKIPLSRIISGIPDDIWAESQSYARRKSGSGKSRILPVNRYQYLLVQTVDRYPAVLGLHGKDASRWRDFFAKRYEKAIHVVNKSGSPAKDEHFIAFKGFWNVAMDRIQEGNSDAVQVFGHLRDMLDISDEKTMLRREVAKSCVWQFIRLSDPMVDLYCADLESGKAGIQEISYKFVDYILTNEHARLLRRQIKDWLDNIGIIITNCFSGENVTPLSLAVREHYTELRNPQFAVGMKGGDINKTALSQFKTPGHPAVIVCTDILKEGEDLHLFCDDVMHYGIAWTSGDLEQRVGRVDRYFWLFPNLPT